MSYMDEEERAGADIWDKIKPRRYPMVPGMPVQSDDPLMFVEGASASTRPRDAVERQRPRPGRPPIIDESRAPPPPARPRDAGPRRWDMNKKAPSQWQQEQQPRRDWSGSDAIDPGQDPREQARMIQGAYQAGRTGDTGAQGSFPNTPFGRKQRAAYEQGRRDAARQAQR
jgi:hypothetical protein